MVSRQTITAWHQSQGGKIEDETKAKFHALRILHEVCELCFATGATWDEIQAAAIDEREKVSKEGTLGMIIMEDWGSECADISFTLDTFCGNAGINLDMHREDKFKILQQREWFADANGVLWRKLPKPNAANVLRSRGDDLIRTANEGEGKGYEEQLGYLLHEIAYELENM